MGDTIVSTLLQLLVVTFIGLCLAQPTPPGLRARITTKGMDYVSSVAVKILREKVRGIRIKDVFGESHIGIGDAKYSFTRMQLEGFSGLGTKVVPVAGRGLEWTANIGDLSVNGGWEYELELFFFDIDDDGSFSASVSDVSFKMGLSLGRDPQGHLTARSSSCSANVGGASVRFSGGASWLYNLFSDEVEDLLKDELKEIICREAIEAVNDDANRYLSRIDLSVGLGKDDQMMLDYAIAAAPIFTVNHVETYHKGDVYWTAGEQRSSVRGPAPLPESTESSSMLYVWASDYVLRTFADIVQTHGILQRHLHPNDFPIHRRGVFNTTCHVGLCIGGAMAQLGRTYPNTTMSMRLASSVTPNVTITPRGVRLRFQGSIEFSANVLGEEKHALTANVTLFILASASIDAQNNRVTGQIARHRVRIAVADSAIGFVHDAGLQFSVAAILNMFVVPQLNELGAKGISIPNIGEVKLVNPHLQLFQNAIMVKTDVSGIPRD
ncbi:unnamed protein product [Owenia fusiformis]|uniref:Uncharacterized protein n=1 Tax=Owenia fusiformis TaxID=6347 RepID=A0A8J1XRA6_OWEFU|nr:unnamed protein product [Owenia fusiformis]